MSPQAASVSAAHNRTGAAQRLRPILPSRPPAKFATSATLIARALYALLPADDFDLPRPQRFYSRAAACLNPATDTNGTIFQRLNSNTSSLERRQRPLWNSHSKVPCPVSP